MKKIISLLCLVVLVLGCTEKNAFTVKGKVSDVDLNGKPVYLSLYDQEGLVSVDTSIIQNNSFQIKGTIEEPTVYYISMDYDKNFDSEITMGIPINIEPGTITIDIIGNDLKIGGNPDNDAYNPILAKQIEMITKTQPIIEKQTLQTDESAIEIISDENAEIIKHQTAFGKVLLDYLTIHINTPLGEEVFRANYNYLSPKELESVLNAASEDLRSQPEIQELIASIKAYMRQEQEQNLE